MRSYRSISIGAIVGVLCTFWWACAASQLAAHPDVRASDAATVQVQATEQIGAFNLNAQVQQYLPWGAVVLVLGSQVLQTRRLNQLVKLMNDDAGYLSIVQHLVTALKETNERTTAYDENTLHLPPGVVQRLREEADRLNRLTEYAGTTSVEGQDSRLGESGRPTAVPTSPTGQAVGRIGDGDSSPRRTSER